MTKLADRRADRNRNARASTKKRTPNPSQDKTPSCHFSPTHSLTRSGSRSLARRCQKPRARARWVMQVDTLGPLPTREKSVMVGGTAGRDRRILAEGRERVRGFALSQKSQKDRTGHAAGNREAGDREQASRAEQQPLAPRGSRSRSCFGPRILAGGARPEAARCGRREEPRRKTRE